MNTVVERTLPDWFLHSLGLYMQTAAHIELAVWQITMFAEGAELQTGDEWIEYVDLKLKTSDLLSRFRSSAENCPPFLAQSIVSADEVKVGLETRNAVAHGAFYEDREDGHTLRIIHFYARGPKKQREYYELDQAIPPENVAQTIQIADDLLERLIALRSMIKVWRNPDLVDEDLEPR